MSSGALGGRLAEDAEPRERVLAEVAAGLRAGDGGAGDAAGAVGADDELGLDLERPALRVDRDDPRGGRSRRPRRARR